MYIKLFIARMNQSSIDVKIETIDFYLSIYLLTRQEKVITKQKMIRSIKT
jgi:hypothetical protein